MKIFNGPKPDLFEAAKRSVLRRPAIEPVSSAWDPSGELLDTAGRHAAAYMFNRPLAKDEGVPWADMSSMAATAPKMLLVPDLETGLRLSPNIDIRLMDQDGVTIPARKNEYGTRKAALSNGSIWSVFAGSALLKYLDMAGLNFMRLSKNGSLDVAVSTSSSRLPRQGLLKEILTANGFDEVLFGFERGNPSVLESSLGQYLLNLIGSFIQKMDRDIIEVATVFDIFHPLAPMSSTDPTGGDGLFARQVSDWIGTQTNRDVRTTLTMINPLIQEQPMRLDIRNAQLVPIEV
jgi:hypothetical protein